MTNKTNDTTNNKPMDVRAPKNAIDKGTMSKLFYDETVNLSAGARMVLLAHMDSMNFSGEAEVTFQSRERMAKYAGMSGDTFKKYADALVNDGFLIHVFEQKLGNNRVRHYWALGKGRLKSVCLMRQKPKPESIENLKIGRLPKDKRDQASGSLPKAQESNNGQASGSLPEASPGKTSKGQIGKSSKTGPWKTSGLSTSLSTKGSRGAASADAPSADSQALEETAKAATKSQDVEPSLNQEQDTPASSNQDSDGASFKASITRGAASGSLPKACADNALLTESDRTDDEWLEDDNDLLEAFPDKSAVDDEFQALVDKYIAEGCGNFTAKVKAQEALKPVDEDEWL